MAATRILTTEEDIYEKHKNHTFSFKNVSFKFAMKLFFQIVLIFILFILILFGISSLYIVFYRIEDHGDHNIPIIAIRNQAKVKITKMFEYQTGDDFRGVEYYGKEDLFNRFVNEMSMKVHHINTLKPHQLNQMFRINSMHNFLLGLPGTGKTHFVKKLMLLLDVRLKRMKIANENNEKISSIKEWDYSKMSDNLKKTIDGMESRVHLYCVTLADIQDKMSGEAERAMTKLFKTVRVEEDYKMSIVLFDEAEAFFSNAAVNDKHVMGLNCAFLSAFDNMGDQPNPVFFMAITNVYRDIAESYKLRFFNSVLFEMPDKAEMEAVVDGKLKGLVDADTLKKVKLLMKHTVSQAVLVNKLTEAFEYDMMGTAVKFDIEKFEEEIDTHYRQSAK